MARSARTGTVLFSAAVSSALRGRPRRRSTGFTLIEMLVVCSILVITAALIIPNMANIRDTQVASDAVPSVGRLITFARDQAIAQRTTAILAYDPSTSSLTVKQDTTVDPNTPTLSLNSVSQGAGSSSLPSGTGGTSIQLPTVPTIDPDNPAISKTLTLPTSVQVTSFQNAGKDVDSAEFQIRFYPDGTCDSGGIGFTVNTATQSLSIDDFGYSTYVDGDLPDPTTEKWEAGQFEPRQNATQ